MSLFSTPSTRVFNSENAESVIQRKPGVTPNLIRQPFADKAINIKSPDVHLKKSLKVEPEFDKEQRSPAKSPVLTNLNLEPEDIFSYEDKEIFDDNLALVSNTTYIKEEDTVQIMKNFHGFGVDTPPPSPCKYQEFPMPRFGDVDLSSAIYTPETSFDLALIDEVHVDLPTFNFGDFCNRALA